jgi:translocation protein SEC63
LEDLLARWRVFSSDFGCRHPDKNPDNKEVASEMFVAISRAYKTLTDEVSKKNWIEYGNPDGPQGFSIGIALPAWLVERHNSYLVLIVYIGLMLVVLPYGAVSMWNHWKTLAPNDVIYDTMYLFGRKLKAGMTLKPMLELLSGSAEYASMPLRKADEADLKPVIEKLLAVEKELRLSPKIIDDDDLRKQGHVIKVNILLHAHLNRLHGTLSPQLRRDLAVVLEKSPLLASGLLSMLQQMGRGQVPLPLIETAMKLQQCILQGVWPHQELLQLPHVHDALTKEMAKKRVKTLQQLAALPADQRRRILTGADAHNHTAGLYLTAAQATEIEAVLARLPLAIAVVGDVKVEDEIAFISPGSIVSVSVTCERTTLADAKERSKISAADADNVAALIASGVKLKGSAARVAAAAAAKAMPNKKADASENSEVSSSGADADADAEDDWKAEKDDDQRVVELGVVDSFAPLVPFDHPERHWVFLVDQRQFVQGLIKKTTINGAGRENEKLKLQFQAPPAPGKYNYTLFVVPDAYVGLEQRVEFQIQVHPAPELPPAVDEVFSDEEVSISDDEADDDDDDDDADDK